MGFGGQSGAEKGRSAKTEGYASSLADLSGTASNRSDKSFKWFKQAAGGAKDFWSNILGGDRNAMNEFLGPEMSKIGQGASQQRSRLSEGMRGPGQVSAMTNISNQQHADTSNAILGARPQAAGQLGQLGGLFGATSLGESSQAAQGYQGAGQMMMGLNQEAEAVRQRQSQAWTGLGSGLGGLFGGK